jgi:hypothetical protein
MEENPGLDDVAMLAKINEKYPFGERRYLPYKIWLEERAKVFAQSSDPAMRVCAACGAGLQKPCRPIGDDDELRGDQMVFRDAMEAYDVRHAKELVGRIYHRARLGGTGSPLPDDTLPLFQWGKT